MALSKAERDALPDSDFAFPRTRQCPIHDAKHVSMAHDMVSTTKGVTEEERQTARERIVKRAHELGMDTSDWTKLKAMSLDVSMSAMSLAVPDGEHPNKMPFKGVLVWLDEPSDKPPHGSGGRKVIMTRSAAEKAVPTLLGMGVNFVEKFDGHDPQKKIGIISEANVRQEGSRWGLFIEGFVYASDFPNAATRIRADKDVLGFSFEATNITLADPGAAILAVEECVFTGAAILRKDKAAFMTTALAAQAEGQLQEIEMTPEEMKAIVAEAMKPTTDAVTAIGSRLEKVEASTGKIEAANMLPKVEKHAAALEACADGMEAAGIGGHPTMGHAVTARKMAASIRASAVGGSLPSVFRDFAAASDDGSPNTKSIATAIAAAVDGATKPLLDKIGGLETKLTDLSTKAFNASAEPPRRSVPAEVVTLLAKGGLDLKDDTQVTVAQVNDILAKADVTGVQAIEAKLKLQAAGRIAA